MKPFDESSRLIALVFAEHPPCRHHYNGDSQNQEWKLVLNSIPNPR